LGEKPAAITKGGRVHRVTSPKVRGGQKEDGKKGRNPFELQTWCRGATKIESKRGKGRQKKEGGSSAKELGKGEEDCPSSTASRVLNNLLKKKKKPLRANKEEK